jgi:TPR repeat protein
MKTLLLTLALLVTAFAWAGDLEEADDALLQKDWQTALKKYKAAAAKGDAYAQLQVGNIYSTGNGSIRKNEREAVRWYKFAAAQGYANAQQNLGYSYERGEGVLQDYAEAARLYKLAASQGLPIAQRSLGLMYWEGIGVSHDLVRAHMWTNLAAANCDAICDVTSVENTRKFREKIAKALTPKQITQAQMMARQCQSRNFKNCD